MEPENSFLHPRQLALTWSLSPRHGAFSDCGTKNGVQIRMGAANILNKQSRTADKG